MARVSENNQVDRRVGKLWWPRQAPRMARVLRRDGTWKDVRFALSGEPKGDASAAGSLDRES
ncbi:MAG TPA: hypothetical protein VHX37_08130 [Acidobacteriaceae bacterium]|jgi:hypothetical protein|nr:hypothetical protein [Acidobacteriaceae bacterium]